MLRKIWEKCVNYETVSYIICGFLTTAVDFAVYALLRQIEIGVGLMAGGCAVCLCGEQADCVPQLQSKTFLPCEGGGSICSCQGILRGSYLGAYGCHGKIRR